MIFKEKIFEDRVFKVYDWNIVENEEIWYSEKDLKDRYIWVGDPYIMFQKEYVDSWLEEESKVDYGKRIEYIDPYGQVFQLLLMKSLGGAGTYRFNSSDNYNYQDKYVETQSGYILFAPTYAIDPYIFNNTCGQYSRFALGDEVEVCFTYNLNTGDLLMNFMVHRAYEKLVYGTNLAHVFPLWALYPEWTQENKKFTKTIITKEGLSLGFVYNLFSNTTRCKFETLEGVVNRNKEEAFEQVSVFSEIGLSSRLISHSTTTFGKCVKQIKAQPELITDKVGIGSIEAICEENIGRNVDSYLQSLSIVAWEDVLSLATVNKFEYIKDDLFTIPNSIGKTIGLNDLTMYQIEYVTQPTRRKKDKSLGKIEIYKVFNLYNKTSNRQKLLTINLSGGE